MTQKDTGFKTITLADFRATMEVPEKYRYADIKRYAITPAVEELNAKADIYIGWKETKRPRAVYSLQFTFKFVNKGKPVQTELDLCRAAVQCVAGPIGLHTSPCLATCRARLEAGPG